MSFDSIETSAQDGAPVEIYTFMRDAAVWRFTSADRDVTVSSATYTQAAIRRSEVEAGQELIRSGITLDVPRTFAVADLYRISPPTSVVTCLVRQYHEGDGELAVVWTGRIVNVEFQGAAARITMEPIFTSVRRMGLRRMYQRQCPHVLYSQGPGLCNVVEADHDVAGSVDSITGFVVSVSEADALPDGHFSGGYLEFEPSAGVFERRSIELHVGADLTLATSPTGLAVSGAVRLVPGCDHVQESTQGCAKFSNEANFGGFRFMPDTNPFGGSAVA